MSRPYNWQVTFGAFALFKGTHTQKREARRAMHRALRKARRAVLKEQRDAVGVVWAEDGELVWRTDMTPSTALNPPVRQLLIKYTGRKRATAITHREGIRPS